MPRRRWTSRQRSLAISKGWRSGLEEKVAADLTKRGVPFEYEKEKLPYTSVHTYCPDFKVGPLFIETKGYFEAEDRAKHLRVRESNPGVEVRFLFQNAHKPIRKGSRTTYAMWAEKNGFLWCEGRVPDEWLP